MCTHTVARWLFQHWSREVNNSAEGRQTGSQWSMHTESIYLSTYQPSASDTPLCHCFTSSSCSSSACLHSFNWLLKSRFLLLPCCSFMVCLTGEPRQQQICILDTVIRVLAFRVFEYETSPCREEVVVDECVKHKILSYCPIALLYKHYYSF